MQNNPKIPASVLFQRIREKGFMGSYTRVREWVSTQRAIPARAREGFLRIDFQPGECVQVDWGEFGDVFGNGVKVHCFVMVLCFSRLLYIEFTRSEKFEDFIRAHENGFRFFGGVPQEAWYDNLASAVTDRMGQLVRFNARFMAYMGHHGIRPHACNPARGNEKGRVEEGVKYVRYNFWPGRSYASFDDINLQAAAWRDQYANRREHGTTRKIPLLQFENEERKYLRALNPHSYDCDEVFSRVVPPQFHIVYDTNRYSVPWTLVGMTVTVRVNEREITVHYHDKFITRHTRSFGKNQVISKPEHTQGLLERKPGAGREGWQIAAVKNLGPKMRDYLDLLRSGHRSLRSEVSRILALSTVYGEAEVYAAAVELLGCSIVGVENLELLLKNRHSPEGLSPRPLQFRNEKLNRVVPTVDLRRYDALLFESTANHNLASTKGENENGDPNQP